MNSGIALALLCAATVPKTTTQKMKRPAYLPAIARSLLDSRMNNHGLNVMRLSVATVLLQYDDAADAVESIVAEPGMSRVPEGDDTLNASLPKRFFDLQDQLHTRAQSLADAIKRHNDADIATAYSRMTETCIACHSVYLKGAGDAAAAPH